MCNVKVSPNARIIPKLKPGFPLHDMLPNLSRSEIEEQMRIIKN